MAHDRAATPEHQAHETDGRHDHAAMLRRCMCRDFVNIRARPLLIAAPLAGGDREPAMFWSEPVSGALIVTLATLTLWPRFDLA